MAELPARLSMELGLDIPQGNFTLQSGVGLTRAILAGSAMMGASLVVFPGQVHVFPPRSDVYRDLLVDGSMVFVAVPNLTAAPPVTAHALRIGVSITSASDIVSDRILAITDLAYLNPYVTPLS